MWSSDDIKDRIEVIERDSRYLASLKKPADIRINAPLALIQMGYENEIRTLRTVLGEDYTTIK